MAAIVLVLIGLSLIVGWSSLMKSVARLFVGLVLIITFLPCVLNSCQRPQAIGSGGEDFPFGALLFLILAGAGYVLWEGRSVRKQQGEARSRLHAHPRRRALPPPPSGDTDESAGGDWERLS